MFGQNAVTHAILHGQMLRTGKVITKTYMPTHLFRQMNAYCTDTMAPTKEQLLAASKVYVHCKFTCQQSGLLAVNTLIKVHVPAVYANVLLWRSHSDKCIPVHQEASLQLQLLQPTGHSCLQRLQAGPL